jgi:serine/threonine protein kinase
MGICTDNNDVYIVTEFVTGGNLRKKLKEKTVNLSWTLRYAHPLLPPAHLSLRSR